jgi:hypothetical protein
MSLTRFVLPGLMLGLVLSLVPSVAKAGVVYGNLGNAGTDDPTEFSPTYLINTAGTGATTNRALAQAFNTGAATFGALKLNSVSLALYAQTTNKSATLSVFTGLTEPTTFVGSSLTSTVPVNSSAPFLVDFSFSLDPQDGLQLSDNTQYWVVLDTNGVYWADSGIAPTGLNGSTYSYGDTSRKNGSNVWVNTSATMSGLGISINAVPEPSTYVMAGIGAGIVGLTQIRRRKR